MGATEIIPVPNGWNLEVSATAKRVYVAENMLGPGMGRYFVQYHRIPSTKTVRVIIFAGSTSEERMKALRVGSAIARGQHGVFLWVRRRMRNGKNWYFRTTVGTPIREAEEFERLTEQISDPIERELQSIIRAEFERRTAATDVSAR